MALDYMMTFAGIPFVDDEWINLPDFLSSDYDLENDGDEKEVSPPRERDGVRMLDELNRLSPFVYSTDFKSPLSGNDQFSYSVGIRTGEFYYPPTASRWSSFRALATSSQVKEMIASTGASAASLKIVQLPTIPGIQGNLSTFTIQTSLYMLPARAVAEHGREDGLFIVTLVDERYYWQFKLITVSVTVASTWGDLLTSIATSLGISLTWSSIDASYGTPNPDYPLWNSPQRPSTLLDVIANTIGRVLVRNLNGTYVLLTMAESQARFLVNRPSTNAVVATAGGDFFYQGGILAVGNENQSKNTVVPSSIDIVYPRYSFQSGGSYSEVIGVSGYVATVPIASGGSSVSGLTGVNSYVFRSQLRALTSGSAASTPTNASGLLSNAMRIAQDFYNYQTMEATDQTRPGIVTLLPEGFHSIVWTFSKDRKQASTRLVRAEWNAKGLEYQDATAGFTGGNTFNFDFQNVVWVDVDWTFQTSIVNFTQNTVVNFIDVEVTFDINTNVFFYSPVYVTGPFYWLYEGDTYISIDFDNLIRQINYTANNASGLIENEVTLIEAPLLGARVTKSITVYNPDPGFSAEIFVYLFDEDNATSYYLANMVLPPGISLKWKAPVVLEAGKSIKASVQGTLDEPPEWQSDWFSYPEGWTNAFGRTEGTDPVIVWRSPAAGEPVEILACLTVCNRDTVDATVTVQFIEDEEIRKMETVTIRPKQTLVFDETIVLDKECKRMEILLAQAVTTRELDWTCNWRENADVVETCPVIPSIEIEGGNNQTTVVETVFAAPLSVLVEDEDGNPLEGYSVTFTPPGAGASCSLSDLVVVTGTDGIAATTATANATIGAYTVEAALLDVLGTPSVQFNLENVELILVLSIYGGNNQTTVVETVFTEPLVVLVENDNGDPMAGVSVMFAVPGSGASCTLDETTVVTDIDGRAEVVATANATIGSYDVIATLTDYPDVASVTFELENVPAASVVTCTCCDDNDGPGYFRVEIAGIENAPTSTENYEFLNGVHYLPFDNTVPATVCTWTKTFVDPNPSGRTVYISVYQVCAAASFSGFPETSCELAIIGGTPVATTLVFWKDFNMTDCLGFDDSLPFVSQSVAGDGILADASASTCHVEAVV